MQEKSVNTWEELQGNLAELRAKTTSSAQPAPDLLFRGQEDSSWALATTLERAGRQEMRISDYYRLIFPLKPQIESFTGITWEIATPPEIQRSLQDFDTWSLRRFPDAATYGYMIHLRHHGFPSPLLDWTRSPYVAAFFALRSASQPCEGSASIYAFLEMPEAFKVSPNEGLWIRRVGPYVRTHRRHFLQQSDYTMCATFRNGVQQSAWHFANHEAAFGLGDARQDLLWKFNIPRIERLKVLRLLDDYNLNAFSLFESQESLMETLALRGLEFPEQD